MKISIVISTRGGRLNAWSTTCSCESLLSRRSRPRHCTVPVGKAETFVSRTVQLFLQVRVWRERNVRLNQTNTRRYDEKNGWHLRLGKRLPRRIRDGKKPNSLHEKPGAEDPARTWPTYLRSQLCKKFSPGPDMGHRGKNGRYCCSCIRPTLAPTGVWGARGRQEYSRSSARRWRRCGIGKYATGGRVIFAARFSHGNVTQRRESHATEFPSISGKLAVVGKTFLAGRVAPGKASRGRIALVAKFPRVKEIRRQTYPLESLAGKSRSRCGITLQVWTNCHQGRSDWSRRRHLKTTLQKAKSWTINRTICKMGWDGKRLAGGGQAWWRTAEWHFLEEVACSCGKVNNSFMVLLILPYSAA